MKNLNNTITIQKKKTKLSNVFLTAFLFFITIAFIINPAKYIGSCYNGLLTWAKCVLPALFPFFFITKLLTELKVLDKVFFKFKNINKKLFNSPTISGYIFGMSIISGYPVGAKLIEDAYSQKLIDEKGANKLVSFCSNSGPIFIIGTVGTIMFNSIKIGYILYISHILSAILNGLLYRNKYKCEIDDDKKIESIIDYNNLLSKVINSSISSILVVGGFITLFYVAIDVLIDYKVLLPLSNLINMVFSPLGLNNIGTGITSGLIEVTRGCLELSKLNINLTSLVCIVSGLITFGGLSIHAQSITFLSNAKVNIKYYFLTKITQTIFACVISFLLCMFLI